MAVVMGVLLLVEFVSIILILQLSQRSYIAFLCNPGDGIFCQTIVSRIWGRSFFKWPNGSSAIRKENRACLAWDHALRLPSPAAVSITT